MKIDVESGEYETRFYEHTGRERLAVQTQGQLPLLGSCPAENTRGYAARSRCDYPCSPAPYLRRGHFPARLRLTFASKMSSDRTGFRIRQAAADPSDATPLRFALVLVRLGGTNCS